MAPVRGHAVLREANEYVVLRLISSRAPVSKAEIVEFSGLSRPTVFSIVGELENQGLIVGEKAEGGVVGRTPVLYGPNPKAAHVVGVDLGGTKVRAAVADMTGRVLAESVVATDRRGGRHVVDQIGKMVEALTGEAGVGWSDVRGLTVGTPGVLGHDGSIELAGNIRHLDRFDVQAALNERAGMAVHIENDVNLAAVGEHAAGMGRGLRSLLLLAIGTGVGLGIIIDGRLWVGARGRAGEIGYLPIGHDPSTPEARERGALELAISGSGFGELVSDVRAHSSARAVADAVAPPGPEAILAEAAVGDRDAIEVVNRYAELVARGVLSAAAILDPEVLVLGGGIGSNPFLLGPIRTELQRTAPFAIRIEVSALGQRGGVVGAVADARRTALSSLIPVPDQFSVGELDEVFTSWGRGSTSVTAQGAQA